MPLIGTAGHVDHGKSTLIVALTGRDPDRFAEEKRRGLTIDLGFSWADLGDGTEVSFVDVPGHERYLRNMLAGVDALDMALLVVAANEGWMPQTEEHLAVLDLLDVGAGVIALTKVDTVDPGAIQAVEAEIAEKVRGTFLEGAPIVPVSAPVDRGIDDLRGELLRLSGEVPDRRTGRPRLWIDRSFTIAGAGTVVTGSLLGGEISQGDKVEIYPAGLSARVRSAQSHERMVTTAQPGTRVALGLVGVDVGEVGRGNMVGHAGDWRVSGSLVARFRRARYVDALPERGAYQIHIGTAIVNATLVKTAGDRALIKTEQPVPIAMGDRLILRETGRRLVMAGGRVLDPSPTKGSLAADLDPDALPDERGDQLLALRGLDRVAHLAADSGGGTARSGVAVGDLVMSRDRLGTIIADCEKVVAAEHRANPLRDGLPLATLAGSLRLPRSIVEAAVERSAILESRGANIAEKSHRPALDEASEEGWRRTRDLLAAGLSVPVASELPLSQELLHLLIRRGDLVRVSDNLVYLPDQMATVTEAVGRLDPPFGVGEFKDALGVSRKYSMPLLEWLDANDYTVRRPEGRVPGPALSGRQ